jgi:hypothetical protein
MRQQTDIINRLFVMKIDMLYIVQDTKIDQPTNDFLCILQSLQIHLIQTMTLDTTNDDQFKH